VPSKTTLSLPLLSWTMERKYNYARDLGSPWGHSLLQASTCSAMGSLPWAAGGYLLHCGPPQTAGGQPASPRSSSQAAREDPLLRLFRAPPPCSFFTDFGVCRVISFTSSHSSLLITVSPQNFFFLPFLMYVISEVLPPSLIGLVLKILSSHEWVTLGIALFTTQSWAITSVSGKA